MADISANFQTMMTQIDQTNKSGLDFQKAVTEKNMKFSAESSALDMLSAMAEKISNTVSQQARNISN